MIEAIFGILFSWVLFATLFNIDKYRTVGRFMCDNLYECLFTLPFLILSIPLFVLYKSLQFLYNVCKVDRLHKFMLQKPEDVFKFKIKIERRG